MMARRRVTRPVTRQVADQTRSDDAWHRANMRARIAASGAGDHATSLRLRQELLEHDATTCPRRGPDAA